MLPIERLRLLHLYFRNFAVCPYPQLEQIDLVLWNECLPHLLHLMWVDFCLLPMLGVPLDMLTTR